MTRRGPERQVDDRFWAGRLDNARTFRHAAEALSDLAEEGENANPIVALIVLSAVGYGDALTARVRGVVNRQDHQALPRAVRDALGNRVPEAELTRLRRILAEKDAADYGARYGNLAPARALLADLQRFAQWVEQTLPTL